jgi:hypothetical protein
MAVGSDFECRSGSDMSLQQCLLFLKPVANLLSATITLAAASNWLASEAVYSSSSMSGDGHGSPWRLPHTLEPKKTKRRKFIVFDES